ncbi:hypothetical protein [Tepidimonas charontis]|uniref:Terminase-like family protein n=1 Tax=Tepidimonas charontis TaxID=2267262 RepID=A0A554WZN5_9BURK|nr:hypothetical protein [Tepidimonas charontis]TSE29041.1 hypothetical protein Tchar_02626 [Tepidimonas charontis]
MSTTILYPYQRRYLADDARFKAGMWSRQTGKTFTTTLEAVLDVLEAEAEGRVSRWTILSVSRDRALDAMDNGVKLHLRAIGAAFRALDEPLDVDELAHVVRIGSRGSYIRVVTGRPQNKTVTLGLTPTGAVAWVGDTLLVGPKARRHAAKGEALGRDEWMMLPERFRRAQWYEDRQTGNLVARLGDTAVYIDKGGQVDSVYRDPLIEQKTATQRWVAVK